MTMETPQTSGKDEEERGDEKEEEEMIREGRVKFSHFVERMVVEVFAAGEDGGGGTDKKGSTLVEGDIAKKRKRPILRTEWTRERCGNPKDGFTVTMPTTKAKSEVNIRVRCEIQLRNDPPKFTLSGTLADVVGKEEETVARVIYALWSRCKAMELISEDDCSMVAMDETLLQLCEKSPEFYGKQDGDLVPFRSVCAACTSQTHMLRLPDPIVFEYRIQPNVGQSPTRCDCYDVSVELLPPNAVGPTSSVNRIDSSKEETEELEQKIFQDAHFIDVARRRRAYLLSFSQDPQTFIDNCVSEYAESSKGIPRGSQAFNEPWTIDAAMRILEKQQQQEQQ